MRFDVRNLLVLVVLILPVGAAPKKRAHQPISSGVLVFQREKKLEAVRLSGRAPFVLRDRFGSSDWNFSRDGRRLTFAEFPTDVDFFNAGAYRHYVFIAGFNSHQKVLLAAYGSKAVAEGTDFFLRSSMAHNRK